MVHGFLRTLVRVTTASLIVGSIMAHFGITPAASGPSNPDYRRSVSSSSCATG